jgi:hypothetical protein
MQSESISLQSHFNVQAPETNWDDNETDYCLIDCYILNCYFRGYSAVFVRWKPLKQQPVISPLIASKSI